MAPVIQKVQVNIPFTMLYETYLTKFIEFDLNPEIGLDADALDRFSVSDFSSIAQEFQKNSSTVTLHGPFIDLSAGSPDPAVREVTRQRLEQFLAVVPLFKPLAVVCHAGYEARKYESFKEFWLEHSFATWSWMADRLAECGSQLMLENVFECNPADLDALFRRLKPQRVGFCLDTGHATAFGKSDTQTWLTSLGPYLGQVHLHDNMGQRDDHLALGEGIISFSNVLIYLKKRKKNPPIITLEPHEEKYLWTSLEYLAQNWPW